MTQLFQRRQFLQKIAKNIENLTFKGNNFFQCQMTILVMLTDLELLHTFAVFQCISIYYNIQEINQKLLNGLKITTYGAEILQRIVWLVWIFMNTFIWVRCDLNALVSEIKAKHFILPLCYFFSHVDHRDCWAGSSDTLLKLYTLRKFKAKFGLIWPRGCWGYF